MVTAALAPSPLEEFAGLVLSMPDAVDGKQAAGDGYSFHHAPLSISTAQGVNGGMVTPEEKLLS